MALRACGLSRVEPNRGSTLS